MARGSEYNAYKAFDEQVLQVQLQNAQEVIRAQQLKIKQLNEESAGDCKMGVLFGFMAGVLVACIAAAVLL